MMKNVFFLIIIISLSSVNLSFAGFLDDVFKAIGDGIQKGVNDGLNRGQSNKKDKDARTASWQQCADNEKGVRLYNEANNLFNNKRYQEAIAEFERALPIARHCNNTFGEKSCLMMIGMSYQKLNKHDVAIRYFKQAIQIDKDSNDRRSEGIDLYPLSESYVAMNEYGHAIETINQRLEVDRIQNNRDDEKLDLSLIADWHARFGDFRTAITYLELRLSLERKMENKEGESMVLTAVSGYYSQIGDYIKAMSAQEQGLILARELEDKQLEMEHLHNLGVTHNSIGNISKAVYYLKQSLLLAKELNNKGMVATNLGSLGICYSQLGDYKRAISLLEQSLELGIGSKHQNDEAVKLFHLAGAYERLGEYVNAVKYYERSLKIAEDIHFKEGADRANSALAIVYLLQGNKKKAAERIKRTNAELFKAQYYLMSGQPKDSIASAPVKDMLSVPKELYAKYSKGALVGSYTILGLAYEKLGDFKNARYCFKIATETVEKQREELNEDDRAYFMSGLDYPPYDRLTSYEGLIRVSSPEDAFIYSEGIKARIMLEQIAGRYENSNFNIPEKIKSQDIDLNNGIAELLKKQEIALKMDDKENIVKYEKAINTLKEKRNSFIEKLYKEYPEYATIKYPRPLKLSEIKLNSDEVLIEYAVTDSKTLAWLVKNGKIIANISVDISKKELEKLLDRYREYITNPMSLRNPDFDSETGYKLYNILIKDMMQYIKPNDKMIIVPDKKLGLLPFETLVMSKPVKRQALKGKFGYYPADLKYLGDDYEISYYQSASALTMVRTLKKWNKTDKALFVLSDPVFDAADVRLKGQASVAMEWKENNLMSAVEDVTGLKLARLDKTSNLAGNLLKLFEGQGADHLTGIEANETNLKKKDLSKYKYLVFATHGLLDSKISGIMEPALVLSQIGNKKSDNGFLTMSKIMGLTINSDIAALIACETGSGKLVSGEGVMGLGRAFQYAGAKSVLASLWSVAEDSTVKLIERFFYYLKEGKDKSSAIRMARNDIRKVGYDHPFFWAPFILVGEGK